LTKAADVHYSGITTKHI